MIVIKVLSKSIFVVSIFIALFSMQPLEGRMHFYNPITLDALCSIDTNTASPVEKIKKESFFRKWGLPVVGLIALTGFIMYQSRPKKLLKKRRLKRGMKNINYNPIQSPGEASKPEHPDVVKLVGAGTTPSGNRQTVWYFSRSGDSLTLKEKPADYRDSVRL